MDGMDGMASRDASTWPDIPRGCEYEQTEYRGVEMVLQHAEHVSL